jgi:autonomous glycyl radical cofactor GrcA
MEKLTADELSRINLIREDALEIASKLGELEFQKISIELKIEEQKKRIKVLKSQEEDIFEEIKSKYGDVTINIETGEIS